MYFCFCLDNFISNSAKRCDLLFPELSALVWYNIYFNKILFLEDESMHYVDIIKYISFVFFIYCYIVFIYFLLAEHVFWFSCYLVFVYKLRLIFYSVIWINRCLFWLSSGLLLKALQKTRKRRAAVAVGPKQILSACEEITQGAGNLFMIFILSNSLLTG